MEQGRIALEHGADISKYLNLDPDILEQVRLAAEDRSNVSLDEFLTGRFNADQLEQLRIGKKHWINVYEYAIPIFDAKQMREIRLGLEKEINVNIYSYHGYSWRSMREIRLGIE